MVIVTLLVTSLLIGFYLVSSSVAVRKKEREELRLQLQSPAGGR